MNGASSHNESKGRLERRRRRALKSSGLVLACLLLALPARRVEAAEPSESGDGAQEESEAPKVKWREKPLRTTVGISPTAMDLGNEADLFIDDEEEAEEKARRWDLNMKAFIRGSVRVGYGPKHSGNDGLELHGPPRIPGLSSGDWEHVGLVPNPSAKAYFSAGSPRASATLILGGQPPIESAYPNLKESGWFLDAYVTLKFPRAFAHHGGVAWRAGSFGHRYGNAGRKTTGYYRTFLFGKTHAMGQVVTADIDLTKRWELVLEHGIGAKLDVVPFILDNENAEWPEYEVRPDVDYIQGQGDQPRGSNFVHHAHIGLRNDYWLRLGGHYMTSWSPNDRTFAQGRRQEEARLTVMGVDAHLDLRWGSGYLGYARMDANNVRPLSNALQTTHASRGDDIAKVYFNPMDPVTGLRTNNDSGTVDTVLFQYTVQIGNIDLSFPEVDVGAFGMFSHVDSPIGNPADPEQADVRYDRIKYGFEAIKTVLPFMKASFRFDRVESDLSDRSRSFSGYSPRLYFFSSEGSKEYVILNYTYFKYNSLAFPGSPYRNPLIDPDPHFVGLSAVMSL